ncbi:MAG: 3-deoxy-manno-octulosonate cytidylyltransferase [Myxococcota bacterium]
MTAKASKPTAVIPARYASSRFPGKPLALIAGKPMVQHVYERCQESDAFDHIIVATDDARIEEAVRRFGGAVALTSPACASGTDRVAQVARSTEANVYVNVQGDEPAIHPQSLAALTQAFDDPLVEMATLVRPLAENERANPHVVKAVVGADGFALYFSRADVPYVREEHPPLPLGEGKGEGRGNLRRFAHVGIYGYRRATLLRLAALPPSPLELAESLEQLRALENGIRIACRPTSHRSVAVDRPEDIPAAEAFLQLQ